MSEGTSARSNTNGLVSEIEEVQHTQLVEKLPRPPDKHIFPPSGMTFFWSIAIIWDAKMKAFTGHDISSSSLLLWNDFSLYQINCICVSKSNSICVKMTLHRKEFKPLKSMPDCIAHIMRYTLGSIQHSIQSRPCFCVIYAEYSILKQNEKWSWGHTDTKKRNKQKTPKISFLIYKYFQSSRQ